MPYIAPDPEIKALSDKHGWDWLEMQEATQAVVQRVMDGETRVDWDGQGREYRVRVEKVSREPA